MKNTQYLFCILLLSLAVPLLNSCQKQETLGPMEFKITGLRDTTIVLGDSIQREMGVFYLGGDNETVSLVTEGVPNGTEIRLDPSQLNDGESAIQTIRSSATADTGTFTITVRGTTPQGGLVTRTFNLRVKRKENTAPRIFLVGSSPFSLTLNTNYVEPGFTAGDEEDGILTSQVVVSGSVNKDSVGQYLLHYVVTDSEGLKDSVTRVVNVRNSLSFLNGQYSVVTTDPASGITRTWITAVSASVSQNNRFKIFKISDCFQADPELERNPATDSVFLSTQSFNCTCDTVTTIHSFSGAGKIITGTVPKIRLLYEVNFTDPTTGLPVIKSLQDDYTYN